METIARRVEISIEPTPAEMARIFSSWGEIHQAKFFEELSKQVEQWDHPFCLQCQHISDSEVLTDAGREIMQTIGEYSQILPILQQPKATGTEVECWYCHRKYGKGHKCGVCGREGR